jgi:pyruvate ferredoxin oxidoreductase alpha subunit
LRLWGWEEDPQKAWKLHHESILGAEKVIKETMDSFEKTFGRRYGNGMIEEYMMDDVEAAIVAMGSIAGSAKTAVEKLQADGKPVGLIKLKSFIPFPQIDFTAWAKKIKSFGVVDRSVCPGKGGPVYEKIKATIYEHDDRPNILQFHAGLGGKEVTVNDLIKVGEKTLEATNKKMVKPSMEWV